MTHHSLDPDALREQVPYLDQATLLEMHTAGPSQYADGIWEILDHEVTRRQAAGEDTSIDDGPTDPAIDRSDEPLVTVCMPRSTTTLMMARLILDRERIAFVSSGEGVQDLFGIGRLFGGVNFITGPIRIAVREGDADRARAALATLDP